MKAKDDLRRVEFELLHQAQQKIAEGMKELNEFSERISWLDFFVSQALLVKEQHFVKPEFTDEETLTIVE